MRWLKLVFLYASEATNTSQSKNLLGIHIINLPSLLFFMVKFLFNPFIVHSPFRSSS